MAKKYGQQKFLITDSRVIKVWIIVQALTIVSAATIILHLFFSTKISKKLGKVVGKKYVYYNVSYDSLFQKVLMLQLNSIVNNFWPKHFLLFRLLLQGFMIEDPYIDITVPTTLIHCVIFVHCAFILLFRLRTVFQTLYEELNFQH